MVLKAGSGRFVVITTQRMIPWRFACRLQARWPAVGWSLEIRNDLMSFHQAGPIVEIIDIRRL